MYLADMGGSPSVAVKKPVVTSKPASSSTPTNTTSTKPSGTPTDTTTAKPTQTTGGSPDQKDSILSTNDIPKGTYQAYNQLPPKLRAMQRQDDHQAAIDLQSSVDNAYLKGRGVKVDTQGNPVYDKNGNLSFDPGAFSKETSQGSVGDCFVCSSINAVADSPGGKEKLAKMITPVVSYDENGVPSVSYDVNFPNGKKTTVNPQDFGQRHIGNPTPSSLALATGNQKGTNEGMQKGTTPLKDGNPAAGNPQSVPSDQALGQQIIEAAYAKTTIPAGPKGAKIVADDDSNPNGLGILNEVNHGGDPAQVLKTLTGKPTTAIFTNDKTLSSDHAGTQAQLDQVLKNPSQYAAVVFTGNVPKGAPDKIVGGHAYMLSVDPTTKQMYAVNPWDTAHDRIPISQAQLEQYFDGIDVTNLNPPSGSDKKSSGIRNKIIDALKIVEPFI